MALVVLHHSVSTIVDNYERLFVGVHVAIDLGLIPHHDLFDFGHGEIRLLNDVHVLVEAVLLDVSAENFHILLNFWEVSEAFLFWVSVPVDSHEAYGSVVVVAENEAMTFIWREVGHAGLLHFAEHFEWF